MKIRDKNILPFSHAFYGLLGPGVQVGMCVLLHRRVAVLSRPVWHKNALKGKMQHRNSYNQQTIKMHGKSHSCHREIHASAPECNALCKYRTALCRTTPLSNRHTKHAPHREERHCYECRTLLHFSQCLPARRTSRCGLGQTTEMLLLRPLRPAASSFLITNIITL